MKLLQREQLAALTKTYLQELVELTPEIIARLDCLFRALQSEEYKLNGGQISCPGNFEDNRKRKWEIFIDSCMYEMTCVRLMSDKRFDSPTSFHFSTGAQAIAFAELLRKST